MLLRWVGGQQNITIEISIKVDSNKMLAKHNHRWVGGQKGARNA